MNRFADSLAVLCITLLASTPASASEASETVDPPPAEHQIAAAVLAAPEELRAEATVLGRVAGAEGLVELRGGTGELVCLADDPTDDRFHVACYHRDLEPFMARGRELRAEGVERKEIQETREAEIRAGTLPFPEGPRALYNLRGPAGAFDPSTSTAEGASPVWVVYTPYATAQSTGLSTTPPWPGGPWIMNPGEPWAHVMIVPPKPDTGAGSGEPGS